jgi:SsrA-binding protein
MKSIFNKKAKFHYEILEEFEAGIVLTGQEVKSIKQGHIDLSSAYVTIREDELFLINANVTRYKYASDLPDYNPTRERKLLMHKKEIFSLKGKIKEKALTLIPLKVYTLHNKIKVKVALAKGKTKIDKRETIKQRDAKRKMKQFFKTRVTRE